MAILVGTRMDFYAVIYALWLITFVMLSRSTLAKVWIIFMFFVVITIPLQYAIVIGLPPDLCICKLGLHLLYKIFVYYNG